MLDIVHQLQGLERGIRPLTHDADLFAVGPIKIGEVGRRSGPLQERVQTAAVKLLAMVLNEVAGVAVGVAHRLPEIGRLIRVDASATALGVEQPADGEDVVANLFRVEPEPRTAREQSVLGVC